MLEKPSYEELEKRVRELEKAASENTPCPHFAGCKQTEGVLPNSDELFRTVFEMAAVGMAQVRPDGRFRKVNARLCRMVGSTKKELYNRTFQDITHPEDLHLDQEQISRVFAGEIDSFAIEKRYIHKDRHTVWVQLFSNIVRDNDGGVKYAVAAVVDITDRKRTEAALRSSEAKFSKAFQNASIPMAINSVADGRCIDANDAFLSATGFPRKAVIGATSVELGFIQPEDRRRIAERFHSEGRVRDLELKATHADGTPMNFLFSAERIEVEGESRMLSIAVDITRRKQAEQALREAFTIISASPAVAILWKNEPGWPVAYISDNSAQVFGYAPQDLLSGKAAYLQIIHPADVDRVIEEVRRYSKGSTRSDFTHEPYRIVTADGEIRWVEDRTSIRRNEKGQITHYQGIVIDVTDRKKAEQAAQHNAARLKAMVDILQYDAAGPHDFLDHALEKAISLTQSRVGYIYFYDEDSRQFKLNTWAREAMRECMVKNPQITYDLDQTGIWGEAVRQRKPVLINNFQAAHPLKKGYPDGHIHLDRFLTVPVTQAGRIVAVVGVGNKAADYDETDTLDLTLLMQTVWNAVEAIKAEKALQESEEKFRSFTEQSFVGFYLIQDGLFKYVNPKFAEIFGYSIAKCLDGMHLGKIVHPEDLSMVQEQVRKRLAGEADTVQYTFRGIKKTGKIIHLSVYGSSLNYRGKPAAIGTMLDITRELEMKRRLVQSQRMESIGSLAGGIAHDFNNILFPIVGLSEMLMEDLSPGRPEHESIQEIYKAGRRGSDLVKQILAFSRQSEQKKMPIRIQQVLKEVMKLSRATVPVNISITGDIQNDCSLVEADPTQIHQIAMNLITNAYHAVESNSGEIAVRLREVEIESGQLPDSVLASGKYALLSVSDTGSGIDPAVVDKIFDPYFTTKPQGKGTGLGLSVVYGIVKEHHGDIKVYSEPGRGTTINVYLPILTKAKQSPPLEIKQVFPSGTERILLVDDEEAIARLEQQMLERLGYQVTMRVSSLEALEVLKARPNAFDLVISDMTMPNMTGDQLARGLMTIRPDIPIIICTGFSEKINREKAADIGIKGFLMKPIVKSELAKTIRNVLDEGRANTQQ